MLTPLSYSASLRMRVNKICRARCASSSLVNFNLCRSVGVTTPFIEHRF